MEFRDTVLKRRMVRNFLKVEVPREAIDRILGLAQHGPSAGFSQGCAYVVVTDEELRKRIGAIQGENDFFSKRRFQRFVSEAPALIVACVSEQLYHNRYREPDKLNEDGTEIEWPVPFWYFDIGAATMIILLAAVDEGLVAAFTGVFRREELRKLLGIPEHFEPIGVISLGYRAKDIQSYSLKRGRRPARDVVHYERWSST